MLNLETRTTGERRGSIAHVLAPVPLQEFVDRYWGRRHLLVRRDDPDHYDSLFSYADVDRYLALAAKGAAGGRVSIGRAGQIAKTARAHEVAARDLYRAVQDGHTVMLDSIDRYWLPAADLAAELGEAFSARVKVNVYMTPPGFQGAPIHPDIQDVFVLQMEGAKEWYIYDEVAYEPVESLEHIHFLDHPPLAYPEEPPLAERTLLEKGDLLYLPRGVVHRAVAPATTPSLHLTVCVNTFYWVDLLKAAVEAHSADHPELGRSLAPGFDRDAAARDSMRGTFEALLRQLAEQASFDRAVDLLARARGAAVSFPADGHFEQLFRVDEIGPDTVLERRHGLSCRLEPAEGAVVLRFGPGQMKAPAALAPALAFVCEQSRFRVRELPGGMSDESRLVLARRLVREGLLRAELPARRPAAGTGSGR